MAFKSVLLFSLLVATIAFPVAESQLLGGILGPLLDLLRIQGIVYCTPNGNIGVNGTSTAVFANAVVQLQCAGNTVVSSTTTNASGLFSILLDPLNFLISTLLNGCKLVVTTPLSSCNASLPSFGGLVSNLQLGNILNGVLTITNLIPSNFQFNADVN